MCTDETRQEILFLASLSPISEVVDQTTLMNKMSTLADNIGWPSYLVLDPRNIDELLQRSLEYQHIEQLSPYSWNITKQGINRLKYIIQRYGPADYRKKIVEFINRQPEAA